VALSSLRPSGRSFPALMCASEVGVTSKITCTCAATRSVTAGVVMRHPVLRFTSSDLNRFFLSLRSELLDECSEMPGHRTRKGVVLVLQALPDC
jgi:hypothetical protein